MVIETGVVVGYLVAWVVGKAKRVGRAVDADLDTALDHGLERLHEAVTGKLGDDTALVALQREAGERAEVNERTRRRVELSLEEAIEEDAEFAARLTSLLDEVRRLQGAGERSAVVGRDGAAIAGNVEIRAETGGVAAWSIGTVGPRPPVDPS
ncbi:chromosome partitioning protein [Dactylosporangium sp. CS-033363]|uniref:chromosome partitioning protein n=1 Tax=Dactylosporangium sp. CS-033363 TaxID=3239935 RepID=UPI003D89B798